MIDARSLVFGVLLSLGALPAFAQTGRIAGPFSGLFGGGARATNGQSLSARASLFGVRQDIRVPRDLDPELLDPRFQKSGTFAGAAGSLDYAFTRRVEDTTAAFGANASIFDYSVNPEKPMYAFGSSGTISTKLTRRIGFSASGQAAYASTYSFTPTLTADIAGFDPSLSGGNLALASLALTNVTSSGDIGLSASLSQRTTVGASFVARRTFFLEEPSLDVSTIGSNVTVAHRLFRRLSFRAGYRREETVFASGQDSLPNQSLDFGLDYGDALTLRLSRRTTLALSVSAGSARSLKGRTEYRVLGGATLAHSMGRSWLSSLAYARTLGFVSAFREPILQDTLTAQLGGQLATRASFTSSASLMRGYIGLDTSRSFDTYGFSSAVGLALTRRISGFVQYTFYGNRLPADASTLPLLATFSRQTALVGLSLWAPIYSNPRVRR